MSDRKKFKRYRPISPIEDTSDCDSSNDSLSDGEIAEKPPTYMPVHLKNLCWRCGEAGHKRFTCKKTPLLFCSRCGLCGIMSRTCKCSDARKIIRKRQSLKSRLNGQPPLKRPRQEGSNQTETREEEETDPGTSKGKGD